MRLQNFRLLLSVGYVNALLLLVFCGLSGQALAQGAITPDTTWATSATLNARNVHRVKKLDLREARNLPTLFAQCDSLESLHLGSTKFPGLPSDVARLPQLQALYLDRTWDLNHADALLQLKAVPTLRTLSLHYCNLQSVPASLWELTQLENLNLELNQFSTLGAGLGKLANLRTLYLGLNSRLETFPPEVAKLTNLEQLHLDQTAISVLPASIGQLKNLQVLGLGGLPLQTLPAPLGTLPKLRYLDLSHCTKLDWNQALGVIQQMPRLKRLNLNHTNLLAASPDVRPGLKLDTLQASNCLGVDRLFPTFAATQTLKYLDVSRSRIDSLALRQLCRLETLEYLDLSALDLKSLPEEIQLLRELRILVLQFNDLPVTAFQRLQLLPALRTVKISYGKYSEEEMRQIQQYAPDCRFEY